MSSTAPFAPPPGGVERFVRADDGAWLRTAVWQPTQKALATVVLLGGRTEFIEKYHEVIGELLSRRFVVWTCDWRGQGLSARMLANRHKGHIDDYRTYLADLNRLLAESLPAAPPRPCIVLAHSMGGHIALRLAREYPEHAAAFVLSAPMIDINLPAAGRLLAHAMGHGGRLLGLADAYAPGTGDYGERQRRFEGNALTSDRARFRHMVACIDANSKLALGGPTLGWLAASLASSRRLSGAGYAEGIRQPVLTVSPTADRVVSVAAQQSLVRRLEHGELVAVRDARHEVLFETDEKRQQFWAAFDAFVARVLPTAPSPA